MTGTGSATFVFGQESSFLAGSDTFYHFGHNPTVEELELGNQLERMRQAGVIQSVKSLKTNLEGAFRVSATVNAATFSEVLNVVFNDGGSGFTTGRANSFEVVAGSKYLSGTGVTSKHRALQGTIPTDFTISYNQGGTVDYSMSCLYGSEDDALKPDSAKVTRPGETDDAVFHGFKLVVDAATIAKLDSAELSFTNLYRYHRGTDSEPLDAVLARPQADLSMNATFVDEKRLDHAYGGGAPPSDNLTSVDGNIQIDVAGNNVATFNLPKLDPDSYSWNDLVNADRDLNEDITYHVHGQVTVS